MTETHTGTHAGTGTGTETEGVRGWRAVAGFAAMTAVLVAVDLWTKRLAFSTIGPYPQKIEVIPGFFDLITSRNEGAAFGQLQGQWGFFLVVSVLALGLLSYFSYTAFRSDWGYQYVLALVTSGVLGNLHDRLRYRHVRDFLDVYIPSTTAVGSWLEARLGTSHWPTFNVADACIVVGTAFLLVKFWRDEKREARMKELHAQNKPFTQRPGAGAPR